MSHTIAVYFASFGFKESMTGGMFFDMIRGFKYEAERRQATLNFFDAYVGMREFLSEGRYRAYDGFIGEFRWKEAKAVRLWRRFEQKLPCIALGSAPDDVHNRLTLDEAKTMRLLVAHCASAGRRTIGFAAVSDEPYVRRRCSEFIANIRRLKLPLADGLIPGYDLDRGEYTREFIRRAQAAGAERRAYRTELFDSILDRSPRPEAMLFENDGLAYDFYAYALSRGVRIPGDIAIAGIDNMPGKHTLWPLPPRLLRSVTSIDQQFNSMGREAVRLMCDMLDGKKRARGNRVYTEPLLVIRASTKHRSSASGNTLRRTAKGYIARHFADTELLKGISAFCGMTHPYFLKKFRRIFGVKFTAYVNDIRLDAAARMLTSTSRSVTRIMLAVGFLTHENFNRFFKRRYALTPRSYRRRRRAEKLDSE